MWVRGLVLVAALCAGCLGGSAGETPPGGGDPHLGVTATFPGAWSVSWRPCSDCIDPRRTGPASAAAA